jgi:hypothetical protein
VQKGLVVKQRHQAPQGVEQIVIELLDRNGLVGAISSEPRHVHVSTRERDGVRIEHQSQSQVRFAWRGARDVRNNRQFDRRDQRLTRPVVKNLVAYHDLLLALRRYRQTEWVGARQRRCRPVAAVKRKRWKRRLMVAGAVDMAGNRLRQTIDRRACRSGALLHMSPFAGGRFGYRLWRVASPSHYPPGRSSQSAR